MKKAFAVLVSVGAFVHFYNPKYLPKNNVHTMNIILLLLLIVTNAFSQLNSSQQSEIDRYSADIKKNPTNANLYSSRGLAYVVYKNYKMALKDYNTAIMLNDKLIQAYIWRGLTYEYLGENNLALKDYTYAIQNESKLREDGVDNINRVYFFRGLFYEEKLKDYDLAIKDFSIIIKNTPYHSEALFYRGICYFAKAQFGLAIKDFETCLKYDPENEDAKYNLKVAKAKQRNLN